MLGALFFGGIAFWVFKASAGWVLFWAVVGAACSEPSSTE